MGRHANYSIGHAAADRWMEHMGAAMAEHSILKDDCEIQKKLYHYFRYTAHYIVVSSIYMRSDQVGTTIVGSLVMGFKTLWIGHCQTLFFSSTAGVPLEQLSGGTHMDPGRVW